MSKTPQPEPNPDIPQPAYPTRPGPGPKPQGPTHPPKNVNDVFALAQAVGFGDMTPARQSPSEHAGGPVKPDSEGCHAGGASPAPGVASGFLLPPTPGLPRFDTRPSDPPDPQPIPRPHPYPPPFQAGVGRYDALPRWQR